MLHVNKKGARRVRNNKFLKHIRYLTNLNRYSTHANTDFHIFLLSYIASQCGLTWSHKGISSHNDRPSVLQRRCIPCHFRFYPHKTLAEKQSWRCQGHHLSVFNNRSYFIICKRTNEHMSTLALLTLLDAPIIRTAAKSQAKISYLTETNLVITESR